MSGFESLMWELERDPQLSSAFANLTLFDRPPERARFRARMDRATLAVPRLRQRVVTPKNPIEHPEWVDDPDFDLDHHLRWVDLGGSATTRDLHRLAATLSRQPFDRERPLWEFVTIEGLADGRAAMLQRLHHTITDGEGGIRLSVQFLDFERDPERKPSRPPRSDARSGRHPPRRAATRPRGEERTRGGGLVGSPPPRSGAVGDGTLDAPTGAGRTAALSAVDRAVAGPMVRCDGAVTRGRAGRCRVRWAAA